MSDVKLLWVTSGSADESVGKAHGQQTLTKLGLQARRCGSHRASALTAVGRWLGNADAPTKEAAGAGNG